MPLQETSLNFPVKAKALRVGSHCGGGELCRWSDPTQAENPAVAKFFLVISGVGKETEWNLRVP